MARDTLGRQGWAAHSPSLRMKQLGKRYAVPSSHITRANRIRSTCSPSLRHATTSSSFQVGSGALNIFTAWLHWLRGIRIMSSQVCGDFFAPLLAPGTLRPDPNAGSPGTDFISVQKPRDSVHPADRLGRGSPRPIHERLSSRSLQILHLELRLLCRPLLALALALGLSTKKERPHHFFPACFSLCCRSFSRP